LRFAGVAGWRGIEGGHEILPQLREGYGKVKGGGLISLTFIYGDTVRLEDLL